MKHQRGFIFLYVPWFVNAGLAAACYAAFEYGLPALAGEGPIIAAVARGARPLAPLLAIFFLVMSAIGIIGELRRLRVTDLGAVLTEDNLHTVPWEHLCQLLIQAFLHRDFRVEAAAATTGADFILHAQNGDRWLVVARHWANPVIEIGAVRDLFGAMVADNAAACVFLTSGRFTADAVTFAMGKPIYLMDGAQLFSLLQEGNNALIQT